MNPVKLVQQGTIYLAYWENGVFMGEVLQDVDGFYKFWPCDGEGYWDEATLFGMGETLKELNKEWEDTINNDPIFGLRNDNMEQGESL